MQKTQAIVSFFIALNLKVDLYTIQQGFFG